MLAQGSRAGERDTDAMQNLTVLSPVTSPSGGDPEEAGESPAPEPGPSGTPRVVPDKDTIE